MSFFRLFFKLLIIAISITFLNSIQCQTSNQEIGKWDLTDIYSSWETWEQDIEIVKRLNDELQNYKGKLNTNPESLSSFLRKQDSLSITITKLYVYVIMQQDVDNKNESINSYYQQFMNSMNEIEKKLAWTEEELLTIPNTKINSWIEKSSDLNVYKHYFTKLHKQEEHVLPEEKQLLITLMDKALYEPQNTYKALTRADRVFPKVKINNTKKSITPVELEKILTFDQNQGNRKLAYNTYLNYFKDNKHTLASIYKNILESRWAKAQVYGYPSCFVSILSHNEISTDVYSTLINVAKNNVEPIRKYHQLRKEFLKVDEYNSWDKTIVRFDDDTKTYTYEEAKAIISDALTILGSDYAKKLQKNLNNNWIDVYEKPGKRSGAYSINAYTVHPFILMNYGGTRKNVFTLAHESGHSVHTQFSNENQEYINHSYPTFIAEIASILNEHLLLDYFIENTSSPKEKISLIIQGIENLERKFFSSSIRAEFEFETYKMIENNQPLNAEILGNTNSEILNAYYGNSINRMEDHKYSWAGVHHFFNKYFYVFQYATSYAASLHFFEKIKYAKSKKEQEVEISNYLTLLKSGGNGYPLDLLKNAGLDMTKEDPYLAVIRRIESLVKQLEKEMNKI